jgi:hypothetical protein
VVRFRPWAPSLPPAAENTQLSGFAASRVEGKSLFQLSTFI